MSDTCKQELPNFDLDMFRPAKAMNRNKSKSKECVVTTLRSISNKRCFCTQAGTANYNYWFVVFAMLLSSYECNWEFAKRSRS